MNAAVYHAGVIFHSLADFFGARRIQVVQSNRSRSRRQGWAAFLIVIGQFRSQSWKRQSPLSQTWSVAEQTTIELASLAQKPGPP